MNITRAVHFVAPALVRWWLRRCNRRGHPWVDVRSYEFLPEYKGKIEGEFGQVGGVREDENENSDGS